MLLARVRKWLHKPKRSDTRLLAQFFFADEEVGRLLSEMNNLGVHTNPPRYLALMGQMHTAQDHMLGLVAQISQQCIAEQLHRRDYHMKFPEEVLTEGLNTNIIFAAEMTGSGIYIEVDEADGISLRPLATQVLDSLEKLRLALREQSLTDPGTYTDVVRQALVQYDALSAEFELRYVSLAASLKTPEEIFKEHEIVVLFCETIARALKQGYITQDLIDVCDPQLMLSIPRLAIISGLILYPDGPLNLRQRREDMSKLFSPFYELLRKIRDLLFVLSEEELAALERSLCSGESDERQPDFTCFDVPQPMVASTSDLAVTPERRDGAQPAVVHPAMQELGRPDSSTQQMDMGPLETGTDPHTHALESSTSSMAARSHEEAPTPKALIQASSLGGLQLNEGTCLDRRERESMKPRETLQRALSFQDEEEEEGASSASVCLSGQPHREWIFQTPTSQLHPGDLRKAKDPLCQVESELEVFPVDHSQVGEVSVHRAVPQETTSMQDASSLLTADLSPNPIDQACIPAGHHNELLNQTTFDQSTLSAYASTPPSTSMAYPNPPQSEMAHVIPHKAENKPCPVFPQNTMSPLQIVLPHVYAPRQSQRVPDSTGSVMDRGGSLVSVFPVHTEIHQIPTSSVHPELSQGSASPVLSVVHQASVSAMHLEELLLSTSPLFPGVPLDSVSTMQQGMSQDCLSESWDSDSTMHQGMSENTVSTMHQGVSRDCLWMPRDSESTMHQGMSQDCLWMPWDSESTMHQGVSRDSESTMHQGMSQDTVSTMHVSFSHDTVSTLHKGLSPVFPLTIHPEVSSVALSTVHHGVAQNFSSVINQDMPRESGSTMPHDMSLDSASTGLSQNSMPSDHQWLPPVYASPAKKDTTFSVSAMHSEVPKVATCPPFHVAFKIPQGVHQDSASSVQQSVLGESIGQVSSVVTSPIDHQRVPLVSDSPTECVSRPVPASTSHHSGHPQFAASVPPGFAQVAALPYRDLEEHPLLSMQYVGSSLGPAAPGPPQNPPWIQDSSMSGSVLGESSMVPGRKHTTSTNFFLQGQDDVGSRGQHDPASEHLRKMVPQPPMASHLSSTGLQDQNTRHLEEPRRRKLKDMRKFMRVEMRLRYRSTSDMIHRLFVCIAGVADQLQTNFACDHRAILKTVFRMTVSKDEAAEASHTAEEQEALLHTPERSPQRRLEDCALCLNVNLHTTGHAESDDSSLSEPPDWVPDGTSSSCMDCRAPFNIVRRRHHCRSCGKIFCSRCTSHLVPLPHLGHFKAVRVCSHCLTTHATSRQSELL